MASTSHMNPITLRDAFEAGRIGASTYVETFHMDADVTDAESLASDAVAILKACARDTGLRLLERIFGLTGDGIEAARLDLSYASRLLELGETADETQCRKAYAEAQGIPCVADELVRNYGDVIAAYLAFTTEHGHDTVSDAWLQGHAAIAAILALHSFTYGGMALDSRATDSALDTMTMDATSFLCSVVADAVANEIHGHEYTDAYEVGMPRAE